MSNSAPLASRYEIQQQLAKKAGRRTLLARDLETQELVVVKLLSFGSDFEWDDLKLFEREAKTLQALSHLCIPRYLDFFELDTANGKGFALVQSYVAGKSLEEYLKAGHTFSEQEVKELAVSLLEILIYLHGRQPAVIHRDIKPSNILLGDRVAGCGLDSNTSSVYLVDFGSVQTLAAKEGGTMTVVGTYGYMPPEQFGDRTVPASDLYSLGATLITLVTGTHPADLPQKDGRIQFEHLVGLSHSLTSWIGWMTQPSLDRRLNSAHAALQSLKQEQSFDVSLLNRSTWDRNGNNWIEKQQTNPALVAVNKPTGSKVSLKKDTDALEILIPPTGFDLGILFLSCFAIAWNAGVLSLTLAALSVPFFSFKLLFALFTLPLWGAGIGSVVIILFALFGRVRLRLTGQQISLTYELFGFKYNRPRPAPRKYLSKLEHNKKYYTRGYDGGIEELPLPPELNIWVGTRKYELSGGNGRLSEPELDWLAHELSEWLGMPIATE